MKDETTKYFDRKNVLLISFGHLIHDTYGAFLAPLLPLLIEKLGLSLFQAGMLEVLRKSPSLLNPIMGVIADRVSARYFVVFGPALTVISMSLLGLASSYSMLLVLVLLCGVSAIMFHVPTPVMVKHFSGDRIGKGMSYYMLGGELARTLGPLLILGALSIWDLTQTYFLIPFGLAATLVLHLQLRNINLTKPQKKRDDQKGALKAAIDMSPFFLTLGGYLFFQTAIKSTLTIYLPTYLTNNGSSLWLAGISLSVLQFSGVVGVYFAGSISDKIGRGKVLLSLSLMNPLLMLLFINSSSTVMSLTVLVLSGFFVFASGPVILALVHDFHTPHMSLFNGLYMMISFIATGLMTLLIGLAADHWGMATTYNAAACIGFFATIFAWRLSKGFHHNDTTT